MKATLYTLVLLAALLLGGQETYAANRYWVGGGSSANWTATGNTNWSATSGGPNNASVPTSADDCFFEAGAPAVTINDGATCGSVDFTGYTGTATQPASANWNIYGSLTLASGMTLSNNAFSSITNFLGTSSYTLTCNGKQPSQLRINGAGLKITMQDDCTVASPTLFGNVTITQGELDLNGFTLTTGIFGTGNNSNAKTITLTNSTLNLQSSGNSFSYNLFGSNNTVNATGSTINITGNQTTAGFGAFTYNNISITGQTTNTIAVSGAMTVNGTFTFTAEGTRAGMTLANNISVTTMAFTGNSNINRAYIRSNTPGTTRTITLTNNFTGANDTVWRDITIATGTVSGTRVGDGGNNSGITFTSPTTWYFKATTDNGTANTYNWSQYQNWYTATNGGGTQMASTDVPLVQDSMIFDANSFSATSNVITNYAWSVGDVDWSASTQTTTWTLGVATSVFGNVNTTNLDTFTVSNTLTYEGFGSHTWTSGGTSLTGTFTMAHGGGTLTLADAFTNTSNISMSSGTFVTAGYTVTASNWTFTGGTITPTTSTIVLTGNGTIIWNRTGGTFTAADSTLKFTGTGTAISFRDTTSGTYNDLWFDRGGSTSDIAIRNSITANSIRDTGTAAHTIRFLAGGTFTLTGTTPFLISGSASNLISIRSCDSSGNASTGTHTLNATNGSAIIDRDYLNIQNSVATPANTWYAGTNSVNNQAVATAGSGWIFTARPTGTIFNPYFFFPF